MQIKREMKIIINPAFEHLRTFVENLPENFLKEGRTLQDKRNKIKVFNIQGNDVNVKRYRVPIIINRIVYSFFRKSKACKAYYNALEVIKRGFDTPCSIAYIEEFRGRLFSLSYYVSNQCPYTQEMREFWYFNVEDNKPLFTAFAQYTARLHDAQIYHLDYSPGNVLIGKKDGKYIFSLVDINRMKFKPVDWKSGCKNLERMFESTEVYLYLVKEYARYRNFNVDRCLQLAWNYKQRKGKTINILKKN